MRMSWERAIRLGKIIAKHTRQTISVIEHDGATRVERFSLRVGIVKGCRLRIASYQFTL